MDRALNAAFVPTGAEPWCPLPVPMFDAVSLLPIGTWVEAGLPDLHGRPVLQLRELPLDVLDLPELDGEGRLAPEKRRDLDAYMERLAAGEEPPPVRVLETYTGTLRLTDGHRRWMAARSLGRTTLKAWVSPVIAVPTAQGGIELLGMTAELAEAHLRPARMTDTPAFRAWFGDSKVVTAEGQPLVVYHGTRRGLFDQFAPNAASRSEAFVFTSSRQLALSYSGQDNAADPSQKGATKAGIYEAYMSLRNPKVLEWGGAYFRANGGTNSAITAAKAEGYDGAVFRNVKDPGGYGGMLQNRGELPSGFDFVGDLYVAFRPEQIKSAVGNSGTFDPDDPRITFSRAPDAKETTPVHATQTPGFLAWFGDSKVVDAEGRPQVLYHGTEGDIRAFDRRYAGTNTNHPTARLGIFLTSHPAVASEFIRALPGSQAEQRSFAASREAEARGARAAGFDSIYRMPAGSPERNAAHAAGAAARRATNVRDGANVMPVYVAIANPLQLTWEEWYRASDWVTGTSEEGLAAIEARLEAGGHDGILLPAQPGRAAEYRGDTWIALRPTQIKSAVGNSGAFDPLDPLVTFSRSTARDRAIHSAESGIAASSAAASTPSFRAWFGDSKVVDAEGVPLVVYHGVKDASFRIENGRVLLEPPFDIFDTAGRTEPGAWFSPDPKVAANYGTPVPFYLRASKPVRNESPLSEPPANGDAVYRMRGKGDAIAAAWEIAVFDPAQIKLAVGNSGAFDPRDPRIAYSRTAESKSETDRRTLVESHASAVRSRVETLTAAWSVDIRVVDTPWHLPAAVRAHSGFDPARSDAVQCYGTVFIVASRVHSDAQLQALLAHEAVGHVGIEAILGPKRFERLLDQIECARAAGRHAELFAEVERRYEGPSDSVLDQLGAEAKLAQQREHRRRQAREAIAVFAERGVATSWLMEVIAAVRAFARDTLRLPLTLRTVDLEGLVARAARWVQTPRQEPSPATPAAIALFSRSAAQPLWRSALTEALERAMGAPKRAEPAEWMAWLDGAQRRGEFRKSERDWSGVDGWLQGQVLVTRESLTDYVRSREVVLEEVILGGDLQSAFEATDRGLREHLVNTELFDSRGAQDYAIDVVRNALSDSQVARASAETARLSEVLRAAYARLTAGGDAPTKFPRLCIPGGTRYRELLLTLPSCRVPLVDEELDDIDRRLRAHGCAPLDDEQVAALRAATTDAIEMLEDITARVGVDVMDMVNRLTGGNTSTEYRSRHWDAANVVVHLRMDERVDAAGQRLLFLHEIQSDLHQEGRKKGYAARIDGDSERTSHAAAGTTGSAQERVPDAPFKMTEAWVMLAFKRAVRFAVDHGLDRVVWISGEQARVLFDIGQHIDELLYREDADGSYTLAGCKGAEFRQIADGVAEHDLERFVGKEIADRILAGVGRVDHRAGRLAMRVLDGAHLRIGGEGLKCFYDEILPAAVKRWARPFGGTLIRLSVGEGAIAESWALDITPAMRAAVAAGQPMFSRSAPAPDPLTAWFGDSKVADPDGTPRVVYHGTGSDVEAFRWMPWASESPDLANEYAAMRGECYAGSPSVMPLLMRIERPFDADADLPSTVTLDRVVDAIVHQSKGAGCLQDSASLEAIEARRRVLAGARIREESGPYYSKHDFWLETRSFFGADGAQALREIFEIAGFDGITMREHGARTWGAFAPTQVKSALGNRGAFDPTDARIAFSRAAPAVADPVPCEARRAQVRSSMGFGQ